MALGAAADEAPASPEALLAQFAADFATRDAGAQAALFAPDAAFFGSTVPEMLRGTEGARAYLERAWANAAPGRMGCDILARDQPARDLALLAAWCVPVRPGRSSTIRLSAVARQDAAGWRFALLHVSAPPAPRQGGSLPGGAEVP